MSAAAEGNLYRAVWRWHFFAGLIVLPVLTWMALTGGTYLYHREIERIVYADWIELPAPTPGNPSAQAVVAAVERSTGGKVSQVAIPAAADESWRLSLDMPEGPRTAFVRPSDGVVLGSVAGGGIAETIKHLHSLTVAGPAGNIVVEIVAGWAVTLVLTGFYLWWPRAGQRALSLAGRTTERRFWRNFHASVGSLVGLVLLFLAVTGMPWSYFWGARFHAFVAEQGIGRPKPDGVAEHKHDAALPWSLRGQAPMARHGEHDVGSDAALAIARSRGLSAPLTLGLPSKPGAPYLVAAAVGRQQDAHVVYVDPPTGEVLLDAGGRDFGIGARVFEWGIYTHQGQQYGEANRLIMLATCLGVLLLAGSAPVMWGKRRRGGRLVAPPLADPPGSARGFATIMLAVGALFPLTGATMVVAMTLAWLLRGSRGAPAG